MDPVGVSSGDELDAYCGKCKLERVHTVVALVDGAVAKVICKTCGSQHRYRPLQPAPKKKKASKKAAGTRTLTAERQEQVWADALAQANCEGAKAYSPKVPFEQGDVIEHIQFGQGVVTRIEGPCKIEVLFKQGPKRLVCNRQH